MFRGLDFAPGDFARRVAFVVLEDEAVGGAGAVTQRAFGAGLFVLGEGEGVRDFFEVALFFFFAGGGVVVIQHVFEDLIILGEAFVQFGKATVAEHLVNGFFGFFGEGGIHRAAHDGVEGVVHFAHFFKVMDFDVAVGESALDEVFAGVDGARQAVGIDEQFSGGGAGVFFDEADVVEPFVHVVCEAGFEFAAARGEVAAFGFPRCTGLRGGVCQRAAVANQRRADAVAAQDGDFFEGVAFGRGRDRGGFGLGGGAGGSEGGEEEGFFHVNLRDGLSGLQLSWRGNARIVRPVVWFCVFFACFLSENTVKYGGFCGFRAVCHSDTPKVSDKARCRKQYAFVRRGGATHSMGLSVDGYTFRFRCRRYAIFYTPSPTLPRFAGEGDSN